MKIQKRDGRFEQLSFDKIIYRLKKLCNDTSLGVLSSIDPDVVAQKVVSSIYDGVTSCELDEEAARISIGLTENLEYLQLASRIVISNLHKSTIECFSEVMENLYNNEDKSGKHSPILADDIIEIIRNNKNVLNFAIDYKRDYMFDYFGFKTLERSYLLKQWDRESNKMKVVERPQHMYMRIAVAIHKTDIESALKTYELISQHFYTHASPTMFNAGTRLSNYSSCFLLGTHDSIEGIFKTFTDCGKISKVGGGIGVHVTNIRAKGSLIRGTNGSSDGLVPMLKVYNEVAKYINQGGKRKGSFACFVKDTKVCTVNEGVKNIQDVQIGDLVVTHKNRVRPVTQVHKNKLEDRKIYKVSILGNKDIFVTGNHKFWSFYTKKYKSNKILYGWNSVEELKKIMDNKGTTRQTCYVSMPEGTSIQESQHQHKINVLDYTDVILNERVKELREIDNDKIMPVSYSYDKLNHKKTSIGQVINKTWIIDEDLAYLFGVWLGDGCLRKLHDYVNGIVFTAHKSNTQLIDYIYDICEKTFGCQAISCESKVSQAIQISINSHVIGKIFETLFGSYFDGKKLPNMVFGWPKNLVESLIAGLISTDGCVAKKKKNITLGLCNENLMTQIYHLCRINGIKTTYLNKSHQETQKHPIYIISIKKYDGIVSKIRKFYTDDRLEQMMTCQSRSESDHHLKILSITETDRTDETDEYVYTLGVEEDHSYNVEGVLVENCYLEPWHADIMEFLDLKKNQGHDDIRARDLFYAIWMPDLFMKQVEKDDDWYLMCPDECPGLTDVYGEQFEELYWQYVKERKYKRVVKAHDIWKKILDSQIETGVPYIGYKDAVNKKCNQKNLGTIKSSNLCLEISLHSNHEEYAVCFTGETQILTDKGYKRIDQCDDANVLSYFNNDHEFKNEQEYVQAKLINNGERDIYEMECSGVRPIRVTDNHPFVVVEPGKNKKHVYKWKTVKDLLPTDKILIPQTDVVPYFDNPLTESNVQQEFLQECTELDITDIQNKEPLEIASYLSGIFSNYAISNNNVIELQHPCVNEVQLLLKPFGIQSTIQNNVLTINNGKSLENLAKYILLPEYREKLIGENLLDTKANEQAIVFCELKSLKYIGKETVYDLHVPQRHNFVAENFVVHNCNLASLALPKYVEIDSSGKPRFNHERLREVAEYIIGPMNKVIDHNYYTSEETRKSNFAHRPLGIGVQGLADVYFKMGLPFESEEAKQLNREIFETLYYGTLMGSINEAKRDGAYSSFRGSPFSQGKLQFDLAKEYDGIDLDKYLSSRWDWDDLKRQLAEHGARNSMLVALMPTASSAQIMGNSECFEPIDSCIFKRRVLSGEYMVVNKYLVKELTAMGLWSKEMKERIIANDGSIQQIPEIPDRLKAIYKTVWEISMKSVIEQCSDRGVFVDQMQSMNLFMSNPNYKKLTSMHFYAWKNHLKSGMYYLRSKAATSAGKFSIDANLEKQIREKKEKGEELKREEEALLCSIDNKEACMMCSS